ncbi:MAG: tRNA-ribosyltransferase, partial [Halobacteriales archaeon]|nr:tRNA-ribosyltransferase [Halobacteriales archaeon]
MTEYFEVVGRDGAARIGELRLTEPVTTPGLTTDVVRDAGSEWTTERDVPDGDPAVLTILPHRGLPGGTPDEVGEAFAPPDDIAAGYSNPSAVVVSPETAADYGADAYVLAGAQRLYRHGTALQEAIV